MTTERFVIVAAIDDSPTAADVVHAAAGFARAIAESEVHFVHVIEDLRAPTPEEAPFRYTPSEALEAARERVEAAAAQARTECTAHVHAHLAMGNPWREIVQMAAHVQADLLLVGTHGRSGLARVILGSVAETVVRKARCPVLVVRRKDYASLHEPEIEPACTACLVVQEETHGQRMWCDRHQEHHPRAHTYYEMPASFGQGSSLIRPS